MIDEGYFKRFLAGKSENLIKDFNLCLQDIKYTDVQIIKNCLNDYTLDQIGTRVVGIYRYGPNEFDICQLIFISENKIYSKNYQGKNFIGKYLQLERDKKLNNILS